MLKAFFNWFACSLRLLVMLHKIPNRSILVLTYARIHLTNQWLRLFKKNKTSEHFLGFEFHFYNYSTFLYLFEEIFMQHNYYFLSSKKNPKIIDCGCNAGLAILYLKWLYPEARIIGFEPDPGAFEILTKNIAVNSFESIEVFNLAISDHEGNIRFYNEPSSEGSPQMSLVKRGSSQVEIIVPCSSLANYLNESIDLLKMDIEGAEGTCIRDLDQRQVLRQIHQIIMECHHNVQSEPLLSGILTRLEKNGFKYQLSTASRPPVLTAAPQDVMVFASLGN